MIKKFFPLWFADIISTEEKLMKLSEKGIHLTDFSPLSGIFTFEEGEKKAERYRICPAGSSGGEPPKGLISSGWEKVCGRKKYYVVKHSDINAENVPSYSKWKTANRVTLLIFFMIFCFFFGMLGGMLAAMSDNGSFDFGRPRFIISAAAAALMLIGIVIGLKGNRRLAKTDSDLNLGGKVFKTIPKESFIYTPAEEKQMLKDGRMIKKVPLGWFYAPDKAEEMVEKMASEGWKFYRFNESGMIFYFVKSEPCRIKFVVDYQNEATEEYFLAAKDDGWKLEFTSITRIQSFIVWSKEYDGDDVPEFYTDTETILKRAKRMAFTFGIPMLIFAVLSVCFIFGMVPEISEDAFFAVMISVIYAVIAVEFSVFGGKTVGFYIRMKKKHNSK